MTPRWTRFAGVGVMGFCVQLATLQLLTGALDLHYLVAVVLSVEAAILHNFVWHERWTWRDRTGRPVAEHWAARLARFNAATAFTSIAGNAVFTAVFVSIVGLPVLAANVLAVGALTIINYAIADRWAFRRGAAVFAVAVAMSGAVAHGEGIKPEILRAWEHHVTTVESRLTAERAHPAGGAWRARVLGGEMVVAPVGDGTVDVDGGTISHWRGSVFVPGATIQDLVDYATVRGPIERYQQDGVLAARVLGRDGDSLRLYLKLQRKAIVTATYNTEHQVTVSRVGDGRALSRSVATRIAELEGAGTSREREKPSGDDRGFLWRLNAYWRYDAVPGGVVVELESVTLSRDIPWAVRMVAAPVANRIARESMTRTLSTLRQTLARRS